MRWSNKVIIGAFVALLLAISGLLLGLGLVKGDSVPLPSSSLRPHDLQPLTSALPVESAAREEMVLPQAVAGKVVVLDDLNSEPIAGLLIEGRNTSGRRVSEESDRDGVVVLPVGSWRLETPSRHYRLHDRALVVKTATCLLWATRVSTTKLHVMDLGRLPIPRARVTVHGRPPRTFITDELGVTEVEAEGSHVTIAHPRYAPMQMVLPQHIGEEDYDVFLAASVQEPRMITCMDQQGTAMKGVDISVTLHNTLDLHERSNYVHVGFTDERGRLSLGAWSKDANRIDFSGTASRAYVFATGACSVYRLYRKCALRFRVRDWTPSTDVVWRFKQSEKGRDKCAVTTRAGPFVHESSGVYEASFPLGLPIEVLCIGADLREWRAIVTARVPGQLVEVTLGQPRRRRRLTLAPKGGEITSVTVTEFVEMGLSLKAMKLTRHQSVVTFLIPTGQCEIFVRSGAGEVVLLGAPSGENDVTMRVRFKRRQHIEFDVVDPGGNPVWDVGLSVRQRDVSVGEEPVWKQEPGVNIHHVELSRGGKGFADLVAGRYEVRVQQLPWRHFLAGLWLPRQGRALRVEPGDSGRVVRVVTERPRRYTFELTADLPGGVPATWVLRDMTSGRQGKFQGRVCQVWALEGALDWKILSETGGILASVHVPEGTDSWSGRVRIK